jgi:hypothetical protein
MGSLKKIAIGAALTIATIVFVNKVLKPRFPALFS